MDFFWGGGRQIYAIGLTFFVQFQAMSKVESLFICLSTHPSSYPFTHRPTHSPTQSLTHSSTHPCVHPFIYPSTHSLTSSTYLIHPPVNLSIHLSNIYLPIYTSPIHLSTHQLTYPSIHPSSIHLSIHLPTDHSHRLLAGGWVSVLLFRAASRN